MAARYKISHGHNLSLFFQLKTHLSSSAYPSGTFAGASDPDMRQDGYALPIAEEYLESAKTIFADGLLPLVEGLMKPDHLAAPTIFRSYEHSCA